MSKQRNNFIPYGHGVKIIQNYKIEFQTALSEGSFFIELCGNGVI